MNIQKLRDMNLHAVADELEQLRASKEEQLKEVKITEVKELRDRIQEIHDSGDCGYMLSDVLEMADKICSKASDKSQVRITDEMISSAMSVVIGYSGEYGTYNEYLSKETAREVLEAALSASEQEPVVAVPDLAVLVEALEDIGASWHHTGTRFEKYLQSRARDALAAYRKGVQP